MGEWHGVALPVMPVRHDVNSTGRAAFDTDQIAAHPRPRLILGQGVQPDIRLILAVAVEALDRTGDVALGEPFRRTARRVMTGPASGCLACADRAARRQDRDWQPTISTRT